MKKMLFLLAALCITACQRLTDDIAPNLSDEVREVKVLTRSALEVCYPLTLYAFRNEEKTPVTTAIALDADEAPVLRLGEGSYRLIALAGTADCAVPDHPALTDLVELPDDYRLGHPLQWGSADIQVTEDASANITLYNQVAAVDLSLTGIPADVTDVDVTLSPLFTSMALDGTPTGSAATTVALTRQTDGSWTAPRFYTLPGATAKLVLSIATESPTGRQTYGYTHSTTLEANTPYTLAGNFAEGFAVNGFVQLAGWNEARIFRFSFGENSTGTPDEGGEEGDVVTVSTLPTAGKIWNNHFVAAVHEVTDTSAQLLLLSLKEWTGVTSAYHDESPEAALDLVADYAEEGLDGWTLPTRDEAKLMRSAVGLESLSTTNAVLTANSIAPLVSGEEDNGDKVRYLCDDATYSFTWDQTSVSKAGTKRTYRLRAVKRLKVMVKQM